MQRSRRSALLGLTALLGSGCASSTGLLKAETPAVPVAPEVAAHFVLAKPQDGSPPRRWAVLLPGGSGLDIFGDRTHYPATAQLLAQLGFHAVAVDYRPAYWASEQRPGGGIGQRITWVASEVRRWLSEQHGMPADAPGLLMGWSMGALGVWPALNSPALTEALKLNVRAAAVYYPATFGVDAIQHRLPLLVLTGADDNMTPLPRIRKVLQAEAQGADLGEKLDLQVYPGAHHGFDVASLGPVRSERFPPLIGPKLTFGYDPQAAQAAKERLVQFVQQRFA